MPTLAELQHALAEASCPVIGLHAALTAVNDEIAQATIHSRDANPSIAANGALALDRLVAERSRLAAQLAPKTAEVDRLREDVVQADHRERVAVAYHAAIACARSARALVQAAANLRSALVDWFADIATFYRAAKALGLDAGAVTSRQRTLDDLQWALDGILGNSRDTRFERGDATDQARDILNVITPLLPPSET